MTLDPLAETEHFATNPNVFVTRREYFERGVIYEEYMEIENDPEKIKDIQKLLLLRAENRRRLEQGKHVIMLYCDHQGFSTSLLPTGKLRISLRTNIFCEKPGDGTIEDGYKRVRYSYVIEHGRNQ
jgi:hypothetical protein